MDQEQVTRTRSWAMPPLKVRRSPVGWTMYDEEERIVASADDPGQLVNYAVNDLESDVHVDSREVVPEAVAYEMNRMDKWHRMQQAQNAENRDAVFGSADKPDDRDYTERMEDAERAGLRINFYPKG